MSQSFEDALRIHALKTLLANLSMSADVREQVMKFAMNDGQGCNDATYLANIALSPEFCASYVFGTNKWNCENLLVFLQAAFRQCSEAPYVVGSLLDTLDLVRGHGRSMGPAGPSAVGVTSGGQVGKQVSPHRPSTGSGATNNTDSHTTLTDARESPFPAATDAHAHQQRRSAQPPLQVGSTPAGPSAPTTNPMYALAEATAARLQHGSPLHQQGQGQQSTHSSTSAGGPSSATASTQKLSAAVQELRHGRPSLGSGSKRPVPSPGGGDWAVHAGGGSRGYTPLTIPPRQAQAEAFPPPAGTGSGSDGALGGVAGKGLHQAAKGGKGGGGLPHGGHGSHGGLRAGVSVSRTSTQAEEDGARPAKKSKVWGAEGGSRAAPVPSPPPSPSHSPPRPVPVLGAHTGRVVGGSSRAGTATTSSTHLANGKPSAGMLGKAAWEYRREPPRCFSGVCDKLCAAYSRAAEKRGQAKEAYLQKVVTTCVEALVDYLHEEGGSKDAEDQEWITRGKRWLALLQLHPHSLTDVHTPGLWSTGQLPPDHVCGVYSVREEDATIPPVPHAVGASSSSSSTSAASARSDAGGRERGALLGVPTTTTTTTATSTTTSASPPPPPPPSSLHSLSLPAPPSRLDSASSAVYQRARRALFGSVDLGGSKESPTTTTTNITTWLADFKERRMMSMNNNTNSSSQGSTGPPLEPGPGPGADEGQAPAPVVQ